MFLLQFNMPDRLPRGGRPRLQVRPPGIPAKAGSAAVTASGTAC